MGAAMRVEAQPGRSAVLQATAAGQGGSALRIGIVAGEASGDVLAAELVERILERAPETRLEGIAGAQMAARGVHALWPAEKLAVWGLAEVVGRLPEILAIRRRLLRHFLTHPPDLFVGVDAPDFNLPLAGRLRAAGIPTAQLVSPSVWAWRRHRVHRIRRSVDLMLTLFPFEAEFYAGRQVPAQFVGHPLADRLIGAPDRHAAREALGLAPDAPTVAVLPGSRTSEIRYLAREFIGAMALCRREVPNIQFVSPMAGPRLRADFESLLQETGGDLPITVVDGRSHSTMAAADVVLLASGTATLEALFLRRPMVVAYRVARLTEWIFRATNVARMPYYSLPNLLAGKPIVPELMQHDATARKLARAVLTLLGDRERAQQMVEEFEHIHANLRRNASRVAAEAVLGLAGGRPNPA
jgi:lipid-A-disaccharide synthase